MTAEKQPFEAEVGRVLDLVINSLYQHRDIFLRELISNASDACDRLRYAAIGDGELLKDDPDLKITLTPDSAAGTLTIQDNGLGMSREELVENLGTIARSGTARFADALSGDKKTDINLIGQFGVGFYSAFMVADEVEVFSTKAGEPTGHRWVSDGKSGFAVEPLESPAPRGTQGGPPSYETMPRNSWTNTAFAMWSEAIPTTSPSPSCSRRKQGRRSPRKARRPLTSWSLPSRHKSTRHQPFGRGPSRKSPTSSIKNSTIMSAMPMTIPGQGFMCRRRVSSPTRPCCSSRASSRWICSMPSASTGSSSTSSGSSSPMAWKA